MDHEQSDLADEVVGYLRDSVSVNLVGVRSSGRSRIAESAAGRLRDAGYSVLTIAGVAALRDRPLAVLAVAGVSIQPGAVASTISAAVDALSDALAPHRSVIVIDDADDLDAVSAGAVVAAHARRRFPVLSVTRQDGRRQPTSRTLTAEIQPGVRVDVGPLTFEQLHRMVHRRLPGPVDSAVVGRIATLSGGLPGLVRAILDTATRSRAIVHDGAMWRTQSDLWNGRLAQVAERQLTDLTDEELDAVTALSLTGVIALSEARQRVSPALLERLDDVGVLQPGLTPSGPVVGVFPPLLAEFLRRNGGRLRNLDLPGDRALATDTPHIGARHLTNTNSAILNRRIAEHWAAEVETLRATWQSAPDPSSAVPLLSALVASSAEPSEIERVLLATPTAGADPRWRAELVAWRAVYRTFVLRDFGGAREILREGTAVQPAFATYLKAIEGLLQFRVERVPPVEGLDQPAPGQEQAGIEGQESLRIAVLLASGATEDADAALARFAPTHAFFARIRRGWLGLERVLHGRFAEGVDWALRAMVESEEEIELGEIRSHAYVAALGLMYDGRLSEMEALLEPVLTLTGPTPLHLDYEVGLLTLTALAAGWRGRMDFARSLAAQADASSHVAGPFPAMAGHASALFADGPEPAAADVEALWRVIDERLEMGYVVAAVTEAASAVEVLPDPRRCAAVAARAQQTQSPLLRAVGRYVDAAGRADPDALGACVAELQTIGARLHAVRAAVTRALVVRRRGDIDAAARLAEEAWGLAASTGLGYPGLFTRLGRAVGLSQREREIAELLANGRGPQEIAAELGLSVRTVENHLFASYRKVGVEKREDLLRAVTTWATPA